MKLDYDRPTVLAGVFAGAFALGFLACLMYDAIPWR